MKRALCIWLPNWPLQRLAAARGELSGRAVVLYELHASGGAKVAAYCPRLATAAAALWEPDSRHTSGIRARMPLAEATALASRDRPQQTTTEVACPSAGLHLEMIDPVADRLAIEELAGWCHRFSPTVGLEEAAAPESLLLDVTGLGRLFGGQRALARCIVRAFRRCGLTARVAIADTPAAAWAVAHFAELQIRFPLHDSDTNPKRKRGSSIETHGGAPSHALRVSELPDNLGSSSRAILRALGVPLIVLPGEAGDALAPLPPAALRLPDETCTLLADLGVRRIDQLAAIRRETLLSRFGPLLTERLDQATGAAVEAIVARAQPPEWLFEQLFEHPTGRREMIESALEQLVARACAAVASGRRGMLRLECCFDFEGRPAERFVVGFYRPTASERHVGDVVGLKLERLRFGEPLVAVRLRVLAVDRLEFHQREFFAGPSDRHAPRELAALVDRLSNRLGPHAVVRPWLLSGAQPEFACQYRPVSSLPRSSRKKPVAGVCDPGRSRRGRSDAGRPQRGRLQQGKKKTSRPDPVLASGEPRGDRPLHLEPEPRPLDVLSVAPEGPPARFRLAGRDRRIARSWGPERIETGWWRDACVRRDYYQVETADGARYWLFRELNTGRWYLHGIFV